MVEAVPEAVIDSGINSRKEINSIIPAEKPIPTAMPFLLSLNKKAKPTPIKVVITEREESRITEK
jgi:hypothetical protein